MTKPSVELVKRALNFYEKSPDGQYDLDVVVPILEEWLRRESSEPSAGIEYYKRIADEARKVLEVLWIRPLRRDSECIVRLIDAFNHVERPTDKSSASRGE